MGRYPLKTKDYRYERSHEHGVESTLPSLGMWRSVLLLHE
jgi:hypothetical protein